MIFISFTVTHAHIILLPLQHHHHTGTTTASLYYQPIFAEVECPEPPSNVDLGKCQETLEISKRKESKKKKGKRGGGEIFEKEKSLAVSMKAGERVGSEVHGGGG
ncbi:hypothetical protein DsansV1_C20g0163851 [Dioscorea sansibarensis]